MVNVCVIDVSTDIVVLVSRSTVINIVIGV